MVRKTLILGMGIGLVLMGVVLLVLPGPGVLTAIVGCGLIAQESFVVARTLDSLELRLRNWCGVDGRNAAIDPTVEAVR